MRTTLSIPEALLVAAICFGLFVFYSVQAVLAGFSEARFSDNGNTWSIFLELVLSAAALVYLRSRNFDIASLYPAPDLPGTFIGIGIFIAAWLMGVLVVVLLALDGRSQSAEFSFRGVSLRGLPMPLTASRRVSWPAS